MQLFIILYIEGGSYIDEDNAWEFVCLYVLAFEALIPSHTTDLLSRYEKRRRPTTKPDEASSSEDKPSEFTYHFVGYSSLYPFYCFPEKVRMRLSQFVILPPWQAKGHGGTLIHPVIPTHALTRQRYCQPRSTRRSTT